MRLRRVTLGAALAALVGCSGPPSPGAVGTTAAPLSSAPKTIVVGVLGVTPTFAPFDQSNPTGGLPGLTEMHVNGLVTNDPVGGLEARLASKLPSLDDGSIAVLPDGRMRTVWPLRANVKWHDGTPFTANDLLFTWEVLQHPDTPSTSASKWVQLIDSMTAPDPLTLVVTWNSTYYGALDIGHRVIWPFPSHLLADLFSRDVEAFRNSPYWTTQWVHLGPFRLVEFGIDTLMFERFDDYFLGRPKIDRVLVRRIGDANTLVAHVSAGVIDMTSDGALPNDAVAKLREEWERSGIATIVNRPQSWHYHHFQMDPQWARPVEVSQDVRLRRGLFQAIDRQSLREFLYPGLSDIGADSFLLPKDPRRRVTGEPFSRYPYDPAAAARQLAEAGWLKGPDGRLADLRTQVVEIEILAEERDARERAIVADSFRAMGIDARERTNSVIDNNEDRASFPGLASTGRTNGLGVFVYFHSRQNATLQNRWAGQNKNHYANRTLDGLIDRLYETVDDREQVALAKTMGDILADDLPLIPLYFRVSSAAVARGVLALDDYAGGDSGTMPRNSHLWERA
ncbi:MAG: hypothetical protein HW416_95 [Chloroflexi bacterium]|nr:hypothetical protein [Chloroflexota bacterium]